MYQLSHVKRTARKEHACDWCSRRIAVGEQYWDSFGLWEGEPNQWKAHLECQAIASRLVDWPDEGIPHFGDIEPEYFAPEDQPRVEAILAEARLRGRSHA
jgi:hypothetical protein